jgi:hypothetical protein
LALHEVRDPFAAYRTKVGIFVAGLEQLEWTLTQGDEAKFQLRSGEGVVIGAKATWLRSREDHPEGVLYLTNQRIIFEQKQNVAPKKFFFITTDSKLIHQALLEISIEALEEITATKKGFFRNKDHLEMTFAAGMSMPAAYFWLHGQDSVSSEELARRAKSADSITFENFHRGDRCLRKGFSHWRVLDLSKTLLLFARATWKRAPTVFSNQQRNVKSRT